MKKFFLSKPIGICFLCAVLIFSCQQTQIDVREVEHLMSNIKTYEYGQSLEPFMQLDSIVRIINDQNDLKQIEEIMIGHVTGQTTLAAKDQICRRLGILGSNRSTPVLISMLNDSITFEMALFALETRQGSKVDNLLFEQFQKFSGESKIRLTNIMGVRGIVASIPELETQLFDTDPDLAASAASALTKMPPAETTRIFRNALEKTQGATHLLIVHALIENAGRIGDVKMGQEICHSLVMSNYPKAVRKAALQQALNIDPEFGGKIAYILIESDDPIMRSEALTLAHLVPSGELLNQIIAISGQFEARETIHLIHALTRKTNHNFSNYFLACAKSENSEVRKTALYALRYAKDATVTEYLLSRASTSKGMEQAIARESLSKLNAPGTDSFLIKRLDSTQGKVKIELIRCLGQRHVRTAFTQLLKFARHDDRQLSRISLKSLANISSSNEFDSIWNFFLSTTDDNKQKELAHILKLIIVKMLPAENRADRLIPHLAAQSTEKRGLMFQILGVSGDPKALPVLYNGLSGDIKIQRDAVTALSLWPDETPADSLLDYVINHSGGTNRVLAFRGYLDLLLKSQSIPDTELIERYARAMEIAPSTFEQKKVLAALSSIKEYSALVVVAHYLDEPGLKNEAEAAVNELARRILYNTEPEKMRTILNKLLKTSSNEEIQIDARAMLRRLESS